MKILVADDSRSARVMTARILEKSGHEVETAEDGKLALDIMARTAPPIALLDWQMPHLDGIDVCRFLREGATSPLPYIIMVTARVESDALLKAFDAGADDYITKPYNAQELLARVRAGVRMVRLHKENAAYLVQLQHRQKLESIGELAAGIAHEINTPAQYIGDNARFLMDACADITVLIDMYQSLERTELVEHDVSDIVNRIREHKARIDLPFLLEEVPSSLTQCIEGIGAISRIVSVLKDFARPGTDRKAHVNLRRTIENTIEVSHNSWKTVAAIDTDFDERVPPILGLQSDLNQVFINLIVNAVHAIEERRQNEPTLEGRITVATCMTDNNRVDVTVTDNGTGIPPEIQSRIFDPFFTTKEMGKGLGQGLALSYDIIVNRHGGRIGFQTEVNKGTRFTLEFPLAAD